MDKGQYKGSYFLELLTSGQIRVEEGRINFLSENFILVPVKTFLRIRNIFLESFEDGEERFKRLAKTQVGEALKRYSKVIEIEKLPRSKVEEFGIKVMNLLGFGTYKIINYNEKEKKVTISSDNVPTAIEYKLIYGKSKKPVNSFMCGIWEEAYKRFFREEVYCKETKCIACGDEECIFEIMPANK